MISRTFALSLLLSATLPVAAMAQDETDAPAETPEESGTETTEEAPETVEEAVEEAAEEAVEDTTSEGVERAEEGAIDAIRDRDNLLEDAAGVDMEYQITLPRVWAINVPSSGLGLFFARNTNTWEDGQTNMAFGTEFIFRQPGRSDTVIGLDYADIRTPDGYWLENDDPVVDADWTVSTLRLLTLDVAHHWLTDLTASGDLQLYYGMGLGISMVMGEFLKYDVIPSCLNGQGTSEDPDVLDQCIDADGNAQFDQASESREDKVWPIVPALSLTIGTRYYISDHFVAGIELGFKSIYTYGGLELGYVF